MRMIITDSVLSWYVNAEKTEYKYKIKKWGDVSGYFFNSQDNLTTIILYRLSDGIRVRQSPISICDNFLKQDMNFVTPDAVHRIWKKI
jgi:hypothetical protein